MANKIDVKYANRLGREAFKAGIMSAPIMDSSYNDWYDTMVADGNIKRAVGSSAPYLTAWVEGWHAENAAAPVDA